MQVLSIFLMGYVPRAFRGIKNMQKHYVNEAFELNRANGRRFEAIARRNPERQSISLPGNIWRNLPRNPRAA